MSKCHVRELSDLFAAILKDATTRYPTLEVEFERDLTRLLQSVKQRGIRVFLVDLPAICKHLDRCLDNGEYKLSGLPLTKRFSGRVVIPKFLRGLYLLIFDELGRLRDDYDSEAILFLRQLLAYGKKVKLDCSFEDTEDEVLSFFEVDSELPVPERFWDLDDVSNDSIKEEYSGFTNSALVEDALRRSPTLARRRLSVSLAILDSVSNIVSATLGHYDPRAWRFKHGPGAISEATGPTNKYCWTNWSNRLEREFPIADYGFHSYASWAGRCHTSKAPGSKDPESRMVAVPKTFTGPRLIAAEPSEHQWCQQNILAFCSSRCTETWINQFVRFNDQTLNQDLCKVGSQGGHLATIDLSSASDRVTCHVVGQLFRSNPGLLLALQSSRTRRVGQTITPRAPSSVLLRKFSTMGSACTFPIESLIFLTLALTAVLVTRNKRPTISNIRALAGEVAVFGDDIVIPNDSRELFVEILELLWFKVNAKKSFWTGRFRESCGVDSFNGCNVTPVYWKQLYDGKPASLDSAVATRNNFYQKFFLQAAERLSSTLPTGVIPTVEQGSGAFGLKTRSREMDNTHLMVRYNHNLQRVEVRCLVLSAQQRRTATNCDSALLQYFTEAPEPHVKWESGVPQRPSFRKKLGWVAVESLVTQRANHEER